jgi:amino acid transporter
MAPSTQGKKRILLIGIAFISVVGFSVINTLDVNLILNLYGLLAICQVGFLLFFLSRISFRSLLK